MTLQSRTATSSARNLPAMASSANATEAVVRDDSDAASGAGGASDLAATPPLPHDPTHLAQDATTMSALQRWRRAVVALAKVVADPEKTEQVLVFSIYANAGSMPKRIHRFLDSEHGQRLYAEHRMIDSASIDLDALAALPNDTLGYAYAHFLRSRGLTPAVFDKPPSEVSDPRMQYVVQRLRQTHDLWHVVTGHQTDPASEVALQAFTFAQVRAPSSAILATVGTLRGLREKPDLVRYVLGSLWAGLRADRLPVFPWEDHWATPLREVRRMLGIPADGIGIPAEPMASASRRHRQSASRRHPASPPRPRFVFPQLP